MIQSSLSQQDLLFFVTLCRLQSLTVSAQKLNLSLSSACRMLTHQIGRASCRERV